MTPRRGHAFNGEACRCNASQTVAETVHRTTWRNVEADARSDTDSGEWHVTPRDAAVQGSTLRSQDPRCRMSMIAGMKRPKQRWRSIGVAGEVGCLVAQTDDGQTPGPNLTSVTPRRRAQGTAGQIVSQTDRDSGSTIATAGYKSDHGRVQGLRARCR